MNYLHKQISNPVMYRMNKWRHDENYYQKKKNGLSNKFIMLFNKV